MVAGVVVAVMTGWVVFTGFDEPSLVASLLALAAAFELLAAATGSVALVPGLDPALAELTGLAARWAVGTGEPLTWGSAGGRGPVRGVVREQVGQHGRAERGHPARHHQHEPAPRRPP